MAEKRPNQGKRTGAVERALALAAAAEASVADVEQRQPEGMGAIERVEAARIRAAAQQLRECSQRLASEELMVHGSTGQLRAHPLLKVEAELRKEISNSLKDLQFRATQRAMMEHANAAHHRRRGRTGKGSA
jgi:hypothetical protein